MFIYVATNRLNGKSYVGQTTKSVALRWKWHGHDARYMKVPFARAIVKYGRDAFDVVSAELPGATQEILDLVEKRLIAHLGTMVPNGYNVDPGGHGGPVSASARAKLSAAHRGLKHRPISDEGRANLSAAAKKRVGRHHTPESRAKLSAAHTGKKMSLEARAKMSATRKGRTISASHKEALGKAWPRGKRRGPQSPEHIAKNVAAHRAAALARKATSAVTA